MTKESKKEILPFHLVEAESEENWTELLIDLKNHGLKGKSLKLITADGTSGRKATLINGSFPTKRVSVASGIL